MLITICYNYIGRYLTVAYISLTNAGHKIQPHTPIRMELLKSRKEILFILCAHSQHTFTRSWRDCKLNCIWHRTDIQKSRYNKSGHPCPPPPAGMAMTPLTVTQTNLTLQKVGPLANLKCPLIASCSGPVHTTDLRITSMSFFFITPLWIVGIQKYAKTVLSKWHLNISNFLRCTFIMISIKMYIMIASLSELLKYVDL